MMIFVIELELGGDYYREATEQGKTRAELKRELRREIEDELREYNFDLLVQTMIETPRMNFEGKFVVAKG